MNNRAIIFFAWGRKYIKELNKCLSLSSANINLRYYDLYLVTDRQTKVNSNLSSSLTDLIRTDISNKGNKKKCELNKLIPDRIPEHESFLLLDTDTVILDNIELGFRKAEKHGIALAPAPIYDLEYHPEQFYKAMEEFGVPRGGQLSYNSGVVFFSMFPETREVFSRWEKLISDCTQYKQNSDQGFLTLAMEMLDFNPYTLPITYNFRDFGEEYISGKIRIWHSHKKLPPEKVNSRNRMKLKKLSSFKPLKDRI